MAKKKKEHIIGAIRQVYQLECAHCNHRWEEKTSNELRNNFDPGIIPGTYIECPNCKEELPVKFEYRGDM